MGTAIEDIHHGNRHRTGIRAANVLVQAKTQRQCRGLGTGKRGAKNGICSQPRDGDPFRFLGKGVTKAVENVNTEIAKALVGKNVLDQEGKTGKKHFVGVLKYFMH